MPEITVTRTGGKYEIIVTDGPVRQLHPLIRHIHADDFAHDDIDVALLAENAAYRRGDVGRGKPRRRHLIQERLKDVMIVAVNDGDADVGVLECLCCFQPAETAAHNDDVRQGQVGSRMIRWLHGAVPFSNAG